MPPRGSPAPGLGTATGRLTDPTPGSVPPAPGGPQTQHLGRGRAEMGPAGRHSPAAEEARPEWERRWGGSPGAGVQQGTWRGSVEGEQGDCD